MGYGLREPKEGRVCVLVGGKHEGKGFVLGLTEAKEGKGGGWG